MTGFKQRMVAAFAALITSMQLMAGINLNTASAEELTNLRGVGPSTAAKIIEYRSEHKFNTIEDIMNVKGIGEKTFVKMKDELEV